MKAFVNSAVAGALVFWSFWLFGCSAQQPTVEAQGLIGALEAIEAIAKAPGNGKQLARQLSEIKRQIDVVKELKKANTCFTAEIDRCHAAYVLAGRAWEKRLVATNSNRIADLELAYNFSLSFALLSLQRAADCYSNP